MGAVTVTTTAGCDIEVFAAMKRAQDRFPQASFGASLQGDEYLLAAARGGQVAQCHVPRCVVNNAQVAAVLDHYFGELLHGLG